MFYECASADGLWLIRFLPCNILDGMDNRKFIHEMCFSSWHGSWSTLLYSTGGCTGTRVHDGFAFITEGEGKMFLWCVLVVSWVCGHLSQIEGKWKSIITDQGVKNSESSGSYQVENLILLMLGAVHKGQLLMMSAMPYMVLLTSCRWHHICGGWPWMGGVPKLKGYVVICLLWT